jgi:hypothetical protein
MVQKDEPDDKGESPAAMEVDGQCFSTYELRKALVFTLPVHILDQVIVGK